MWHAFRAELAYMRPWLLGGLGIALGVTALNSVIWATAGGLPSFVAAAIRAMFPIIATMNVAFIAQSYRNQERRARLYLGGPLTPRQLAIVSVVVPLVLCACGTLVAALFLGVESMITGQLVPKTLHIVGYAAGQFLLYPVIGLLIAEAIVCGRQGRRVAAASGWGTLAAAVILLTVVTIGAFTHRWPWTWPLLHVGNLVVALGALVVTVRLYTDRTDFTR